MFVTFNGYYPTKFRIALVWQNNYFYDVISSLHQQCYQASDRTHDPCIVGVSDPPI